MPKPRKATPRKAARPAPVAYKDLVPGTLYGVVDKTSGALLSIGTVIAEDLPASKVIIPISQNYNDDTWDPVTWSWTPRPARVLTPEEAQAAKDYADDRAFVLAADAKLRAGQPLTPQERDRVDVLRLKREMPATPPNGPFGP